MDRRAVRIIPRFARGPGLGVAVRGRGDEVDIRSGLDVVLLIVNEQRLRRAVARHAFRDGGHRGDEAEFFGEDGAGEAAEESGEVAFVVPGGNGARAKDVVEGGLEAALGARVHG